MSDLPTTDAGDTRWVSGGVGLDAHTALSGLADQVKRQGLATAATIVPPLLEAARLMEIEHEMNKATVELAIGLESWTSAEYLRALAEKFEDEHRHGQAQIARGLAELCDMSLTSVEAYKVPKEPEV